MESLIEFVSEHLAIAPWVIFGALMLAGLNLPISEDLLLIVSGVVASSIAPFAGFKLFFAAFMGAYLSDWLAYYIGRRFGPQLWKFGWFRRTVKREKFQRVEAYYERYGIRTLLVGRFIPFGVRNCLFMAAGMVRMPFWKFLIGDTIACLASNNLVFWLAYAFGRNYQILVSYLEVVDIIIFASFALAVIGWIWYKKARRDANTL